MVNVGEAGVSAGLPDVVYVVRPGDDNEELRYSLRSVAENVPHRKVWIAGHRPWWVHNVGHIATTPLPDKFDNQAQSVAAAVGEPGVSESFYLFNDDMYVMRRFKNGLPTYHLGRLSAYVELMQAHGKNPGNGWLQGMVEMLDLLRSWGIDEPLCYEGHMPLRFTKTEMARFVAARTRHFLPFSYYAATDTDPGTEWIDAQPGVLGNPVDQKRPPFLSSNDYWFEHSRLGEHVRNAFPYPCVYEGAPAQFWRSA